ncbi:hypothetical protein Patl_1189 [Paraglaciecola sp. T6c]|uniref:DUF5672 family protein n=1 Tax=Pseudoalteromonas atlantica (strain T6c / ATCC BAA-1087) TaxID=3042615 RepID=UPI00005C578E|nr:DUF5672 family protein [Paraglaciecola sp. T6c]ABG39715.1 hypothetical protein Patl_1189 [Paraglaciecola sp. T6c]
MADIKIKKTRRIANLISNLFVFVGSPDAHIAHIKQLTDTLDYPARMRQFLHYAAAQENNALDEPVFIFSAGWRSGSTLLQRLLSSSHDLFLWGEPHDKCNIIQSLAATIRPFTLKWPPRRYIVDNVSNEQNADKWIANLYPDEAHLLAAHRNFLRTLFTPLSGEKRWGIKEVRFGLEEAIFLKALFPRAKFLYLKRDLNDAYLSYKSFSQHMNWYAKWPTKPVFTPFSFAKHRARLIRELSYAQKLTGGLIIDYRDLVSQPEVLRNIEEYCKVKIDQSIIEKKIGSGLSYVNTVTPSPNISSVESLLLKLGNIKGSKQTLKVSFLCNMMDWLDTRALLPSSAQKLTVNHTKNAVKPSDIHSSDLSPLYHSLPKTDDHPDFSNIPFVLKECTEQTAPIEKANIGVIIETREHPLLEKVVFDFIKITDCRVQLFHSQQNLAFIQSTEIADLVASGKVLLTKLNIHDLSAKSYNAIFLSPIFWNCIASRSKIVVFQTDSLLCPKSKFVLKDFLHFDYIGSWWERKRPIGLTIDGGNGGLSIRDWHLSSECLTRFPPLDWPGGEDGFFAFHMDLLGGRVARGTECAKFSTQYKYLADSFGCHKVSCLNKKSTKQFLKYFPDAKLLLKQKR